MFTAVKYRIYPNKEQSNLIDRTIGCTRLVYNLMLNDFSKEYKKSLVEAEGLYLNRINYS